MPNILSCKNEFLSLSVDQSLGASIVNLKTYDGIDILRPAFDDNITDPRQSSCFVQIPHVHRIGDGKFSWSRKSYQLSANMPPEPHHIHGEGWQSKDWQLYQQTSDMVVFSLDYRADNNIDGGWPFSFKALLTYKLTKSKLIMTLQFTNQEEFQVPLGLGFHPYFPKTPYSRIKADVQRVMLVDDMMMPITITDNDILVEKCNDGSLLDLNFDHCFSGWQGEAVIRQQTHDVILTGDEYLNCLQCYAPENQDFFCVEPVSHLPNVINYRNDVQPDEDMLYINAKATLSASACLTIIRK